MLKRKLDTMRTFVGTLSLCGLLALPGIALAESAYVLDEGTPQTIGGKSTKSDFTKADFTKDDGATDSFSIVSGSVNKGSVTFDGEVTGTVDSPETGNLYGVRLTGPGTESTVTIKNGPLKLKNGAGTCGVYSAQKGTTVTLDPNGSGIEAETGIRLSGANATVESNGTIKAITGAELSGDNAKVDNNGTITATTGAELSGDNSEFNNYGTVTASGVGVRMTGDDAYFYNGENCNITADGLAETSVGVVIQHGNDDEGHTSANYGTISGFATGIEMGSGKVENVGGTITASKVGIKATSGTVTNKNTDFDYGVINAETGIELGDGTVTNDGKITATNGIDVTGSEDGNSVENTEDGRIKATNIGIRTAGGSVTNEGTISANTGIEMAKGKAINSGKIIDANVGIKAADGSVTNQGTIKAATGIEMVKGEATNSNIIEATGIGIKASSGTVTNEGDIIGALTGIEMAGAGDDKASNSGEIDAHVGILAKGNVTVENTGTITSSEACIKVDNAGGIVLVANTGRLLTTSGHELHVASGTANLHEGYTLTLDGKPTEASILVDSGATLNLADTPLTVADVAETQLDTDYKVCSGPGFSGHNFVLNHAAYSVCAACSSRTWLGVL